MRPQELRAPGKVPMQHPMISQIVFSVPLLSWLHRKIGCSERQRSLFERTQPPPRGAPLLTLPPSLLPHCCCSPELAPILAPAPGPEVRGLDALRA